MPPKSFKPPRSSITNKKITKPKSTNAVRKSKASTPSKPHSNYKAKAKNKTTSRVSGASILPPLPDDSESDPDPFAEEDDGEGEAIEISDGEVVEERKESISPELLTKLLHEFFREEGTRITKDANVAVGRYMEIFVREALARAAFLRVEVEEGRGLMGDGFLDVEDLEKLAPQLLLDF